MDWECCWTKEEIAPEECPYIAEGEEDLYALRRRRVVEKCLDCPRFAADLERALDAGFPLAGILPLVMTEYHAQKSQVQAMSSFLTNKTREIKFLHELSLVLQTSLDLDEVLSVAMTAITAGKGFGMNRAFLLMTDKERQYLKGYLGVGPRDYEEAWQIWQEIGQHNPTLREMARNFQKTKLSSEKVKFHDILQRISVPLRDQKHILNRALRERKPILVEDAFHNPDVDPQLARTLGVDSFLVMPLVSRNRRIGVLIADNCITHKPITPQDLQSMETFAFPVAFALERASLYERLQEEIGKLTAANEKLREQQELIVRMEKMALVGRITSSIAHSIRNPLMVIGGFARSLLKNVAANDDKRELLETIVREAKQLESALEDVLNYSDSLYPTRDWWDANQLVSGVCRELREKLAQKNVGVTLELAAELPAAYIDYRQIAYCVKTILNTAAEFMPDGGEVTVRTWQEGDAVVLGIADTGAALTHEALEALTTPFSETQDLGIGLGLPLCKTILEKNGIPFLMESSPAGGTTYTIRLPLHKEDN